MQDDKRLIRVATCLCGNDLAELRRDKNQAPYLTCSCGVRVFLRRNNSDAFLGFLVVEKLINANLPAHLAAIRHAKIEYHRLLDAQRRKPKPRKKVNKA